MFLAILMFFAFLHRVFICITQKIKGNHYIHYQPFLLRFLIIVVVVFMNVAGLLQNRL